MSKTDILEYFYNTAGSLTSGTILLILAASAAAGLVIFITYRLTYKGVNYSFKFNSSNLVMVMITAVVMMMISSNIVISLGMVGALSIIRFRSAIKDPRDSVFIFWSLVEGLSVGSQNFLLAAISTIAIALVFVIMGFVPSGKKLVLVVRGSGFERAAVEAAVKEGSLRYSLRADNAGPCDEMVFSLKQKKGARLLESLRALEGVDSVSLVAAAEENLG